METIYFFDSKCLKAFNSKPAEVEPQRTEYEAMITIYEKIAPHLIEPYLHLCRDGVRGALRRLRLAEPSTRLCVVLIFNSKIFIIITDLMAVGK